MATVSSLKVNSSALSNRRNKFRGNNRVRSSAIFVGSSPSPKCLLKCSCSTGESIMAVSKPRSKLTSFMKILRWLKIPALVMVATPALVLMNMRSRRDFAFFMSTSDVVLGYYLGRQSMTSPSVEEQRQPPSGSKKNFGLGQLYLTIAGCCIISLLLNPPIKLIRLKVMFRIKEDELERHELKRKSVLEDLHRILEANDTSTCAGRRRMLTETAVFLLQHDKFAICCLPYSFQDTDMQKVTKRFKRASGYQDDEVLRKNMVSCSATEHKDDDIMVTVLFSVQGWFFKDVKLKYDDRISYRDLLIDLLKLHPLNRVKDLKLWWAPESRRQLNSISTFSEVNL